MLTNLANADPICKIMEQITGKCKRSANVSVEGGGGHALMGGTTPWWGGDPPILDSPATTSNHQERSRRMFPIPDPTTTSSCSWRNKLHNPKPSHDAEYPSTIYQITRPSATPNNKHDSKQKTMRNPLNKWRKPEPPCNNNQSSNSQPTSIQGAQ